MADAKMLKKVPVREQDPKVRATNFEEVCLGYNQEEAMEEAQRCLGCKKPKCVEGCPVSINIPGFIEQIKEGKIEEAYKVIGLSSALPAICGRVCPQESQCEGKCIRGIKGEAVSIGKLERFVADYALEHDIKPAGAEVKNGHKVAVIGSGPSGLTCAGDLAKAGYDVTREYYINDAGKQITNLALSLYSRYLALFDIERPIPEDGYMGQDVIDIAKSIKEKEGDALTQLTEEEAIAYFRKVGTEHELQKIKDILKEVRVSFDVWFSETSLYEGNKIEPAINKLKEKGYTYEQDGALWFRTTDFGDDKDRVLIKTDGSYTYFTPDIAYHLSKLNRGYAYLVDLLGADHHGYINRMKAAIQALGYNADQLNIDILQMVRMVENGEVVKMSKRTGNAVTIRDLIDDIGVDATRYFFVAKAANTPFDFDLGLAKSQSNENPVYYAQYAHARMCSIMRSAAEKNIEPADHFELINNPKEIGLLKHINEFKNTINDAARTRAPHKIANYIQKLAQLFHSFYGDCHVIDEENKELSSQRLALVEATRITLANALNLIGVHAPEKM